MTDNERPTIKLLPEHLIDQIKAGEVIERPSMVLKELAENALDANADQLNIHIINNGLDLIGVEDNGWGMTPEELPRAFCRHATSKLERFEHIYQLLTYGFRGEALASIAAVSRTRCTSAPKENPRKGGRLDINGGTQEKPIPWSSQKSGTSLYIKDLFFNTPARLKFIKSGISEKLSLKRTLTSLILANPQVTFSIRWDEQERRFYPSVSPDKMSERVAELFFNNKDKCNKLLPFSRSYGSMKVSGFLSTTSSRGNSGKSHFILANRRIIYDPQIHKIILHKAESLWPLGEKGHYFIHLDIPEEDIDVNIHPNKTRVKFFQTADVLALISAALEQAHIPPRPQTTNPFPPPPTSSFPNSSYSASASTPSFPPPPLNHSITGEEITPTPFGKKHLPIWENTTLIKITPNIYLLPGHPSQLLRANRLLIQFLHWGISRNHSSDSDLTPLLVGEPFPKSALDEQGIRFFSRRGFGLETVDDVLSLHTIPSWCTGIPLSLIMPPLFQWYAQDPRHNPDHLLDMTLELPSEALNSSLIPALDALSSEQLERDGILFTPTEKNWETFFPS